MELLEYRNEQWMVISVKGRIDIATSGELQEKLMKLLEQEKHVIMDCKGIDFISSSGLRVFLLASKALKKEGGSFALCSPQESVKEVFDISGLSSVFSIFDTLEDALKAK